MCNLMNCKDCSKWVQNSFICCRETNFTDKQLEEQWKLLEDINVCEDEDGFMYIGEDFFVFKKGTEKEEIWHWFDERHSKGVYYLLYEMG